jgi:hypothetical protein
MSIFVISLFEMTKIPIKYNWIFSNSNELKRFIIPNFVNENKRSLTVYFHSFSFPPLYLLHANVVFFFINMSNM